MHRIDFSDRSFLLIHAPVEARAAEVRAYHLELLNLIRGGFQHWHLPQADPILFEHFGQYYQAVADRLKPRFSAADLTPECRHALFIATDLIPDPTDPEQQIPGLSLLEQWMGFDYAPPGVGEVALTGGDDRMDLLASLTAIDPRIAIVFPQRYSRRELLAFISQYHNLLRGKEALEELQAEKDNALFDQQEAAINDQFRNQGVMFPVLGTIDAMPAGMPLTQ